MPFRLRSGKALAEDRHEILVSFKPVDKRVFDDGTAAHANRLRIPLSPGRLALHVNLTAGGTSFEVRPAELDTDLDPPAVPAYGRLLLDVLRGDHTLSIRDDEAEEAWRVVEPILQAWAQGASPLRSYRAGSEGPVAL